MESKSKFNLELFLQELIFHRNFIVIVFAILTATIILIGSNWPKQYSSSTSIFVEEENILGPLMQGAAVQTEVIDRAAIAREIIFGHNIMFQLLEQEGLIEENPDPAIQERLMNNIKDRLDISNVRNNLIRINFKDNEAERAFRITRTIAELFIEESLADKAHQSTEAFQFIDKQAREYKEKLQNAEEELKKFRSENVDAQPGMAGSIAQRRSQLQIRKEQISQELKEARIRKSSLEQQLSGEAQASSAFSRSEQNKARIAELQAQLDTLRLSYHETYPDIFHIKTQIQDLRNSIKQSEKMAAESGADSNNAIIDERVLNNPVYQQLQRELYDTNTNIETLNARLEHTNTAIQEQLERARKVEEFEARLQELTRDYEVNNESYTDLMRRREQARVSMNLDIERKGLSLRIDEPANLPHSPSGIRFLHFLLGGPIVGLLVPLSIVFLLVQLNFRIKSGSQIYDNLGIPVLGATPHLLTRSESRKELLGIVAISLLFLGTLAFIITMGMLRMQGKV
ncbi:MAG: hypothetical protein OQL06_12600 [Gammaproteobacteria bacterium]|nr:hypothetical protein [Gammaproteobacteria bacterium]